MIAGLGIPAPPGVFVLDLEFAESGYHDLFSAFKGLFHDFEKGIDEAGGAVSRKGQSVSDNACEMRFGDGHDGSLFILKERRWV